MALTQAELDGHWQWFQGVRPVQYRPYDRAADALAAGPACDAFPVGESGGLDPADDGATAPVVRRVWHLRASQLGAVAVTAKGAVVETDGTTWVVERRQYQSLGTRVRCECHRA